MHYLPRAGCLAFSLLATATPTQSPVPPDSLQRLVDLDGLPLLTPDVTCRQFASTDPSGRGEDHGHFLRRDGKTAVLAEMEGPGVIVRLWSANAQGRLRVFFDGEEEPRIDGPFQDLFTGKMPPFCEPIATHQSGGWISYFPIAYRKSCRVEVAELENPAALYYQCQYLTYPAGTPMRTFTTELPQTERLALGTVLQAWRNPSRLPRQVAGIRELRATWEIPAGQAKVVTWAGPATLLRLNLTVAKANAASLRGLLLEIATDDHAPTIRAPLGDFFATGFGPTNTGGLLLGWRGDSGYCHMPMPFHDSMQLRLRNTTNTTQRIEVSALANPGEPNPNAGTLHAEFRSTAQVGDELYEFASIRGPGKYVGITQAMQGVGDLWYLEGNEEFYVDGEQRPSILGTGSEDFYNGGWYWDQGTFSLPMHGLGEKAEWTTNRTTPWRMQMMDAVPFTTGLVARIEHGSRNEVRDAYYSSVVYWYGPPQPVREVREEELREPRLWALRPKGSIPASELRWDDSPALTWKTWEELTTTHRGLDRPLFQAFPVSYVERDKPALDARLAVLTSGNELRTYRAHITVPFADSFSVEMLAQHAWALGNVRLDGRQMRRPGVDDDRWAHLQTPDHVHFFPTALTAGEHEIAFDVPADATSPPAIDSLRLVPLATHIRTWWIAPPLAANAGGTVEDVMPDEAKWLAADFSPGSHGWKQVTANGDGVDLNHHVSSQAPMLAYLMVFVHSPNARTARALLGSDDGVRVWVNGSLTWSHALHRPMSPDQDQFDVPLQAGWNRLLVKVKNDDGGYGVMLRLADPDRALKFAFAPGEK